MFKESHGLIALLFVMVLSTLLFLIFFGNMKLTHIKPSTFSHLTPSSLLSASSTQTATSENPIMDKATQIQTGNMRIEMFYYSCKEKVITCKKPVKGIYRLTDADHKVLDVSNNNEISTSLELVPGTYTLNVVSAYIGAIPVHIAPATIKIIAGGNTDLQIPVTTNE